MDILHSPTDGIQLRKRCWRVVRISGKNVHENFSYCDKIFSGWIFILSFFFCEKKNNEKIKTKTSFFLVWQVKDEGRRSVVGFGAFFWYSELLWSCPIFWIFVGSVSCFHVFVGFLRAEVGEAIVNEVDDGILSLLWICMAGSVHIKGCP